MQWHKETTQASLKVQGIQQSAAQAITCSQAIVYHTHRNWSMQTMWSFWLTSHSTIAILSRSSEMNISFWATWALNDSTLTNSQRRQRLALMSSWYFFLLTSFNPTMWSDCRGVVGNNALFHEGVNSCSYSSVIYLELSWKRLLYVILDNITYVDTVSVVPVFTTK